MTHSLTFGGPGGTFAKFGTIGDMIHFNGADVLDSITVSGSRHGGNGGTASRAFTMPSTGILLQMIQTREVEDVPVISYIKFVIDGDTIEVGTKNSLDYVTCDFGEEGLAVVITGGKFGVFVDSLTFDRV